MKAPVIFTYILFIAITATAAVMITGCSCGACGSKEQTEVPAEVLKKASDYIISKTGNEFFEKYITPDFGRTIKTPDGFFMFYRIIIPEKPYVNTIITFNVDDNGNLLKNYDVVGIPDCYKDECNFTVSEEDAKRIATENNFPKGIKDWMAALMWDSNYDKYVWRILSVSSETGTEGQQNYKASGFELLIDPNTGNVIAKNDWNIK